MAATAAAWIAVVLPSLLSLRPLIRKPVTAIGAAAKGITPGHGVPFNATLINHWFQDAAGHHVGFDQLFQQASAGNGGTSPSPDQFDAYLAQHHYSGWVSYRPNGWFWHFQTVEASGYAILAILLAVGTVLVVRRRRV
jgi:hypothetical protein